MQSLVKHDDFEEYECQNSSASMKTGPPSHHPGTFIITFNIRHISLEIRFKKCDGLFADWLNLNFNHMVL